MSFLSDLDNELKFQRARTEPCLGFLPYSVPAMLASIQADLFPDVVHAVRVTFITRGPLAGVWHDDHCASIHIHQLLNHPETPRAVIGLILTHELIHLRIPSIVVNGIEVQHPPEFWKAEKLLCPDRRAAWSWIWRNHWPCLRKRPKAERIDVLRTWKAVWNQPKRDISECSPAPSEPAEDDGGW